MSIRSKWLVVLIGNDKTGKTTLQKKLIRLLSVDNRDIRLDCNDSFKITHPYLIRKLRDFSIGNRSIQEKLDLYKSVPDFFKNHFKEADLCFISSHLSPVDTKKIIFEGRQRYYNVCGVFFSNSIYGDSKTNATISRQPWNERWYATNDLTEDEHEQDQQLQSIAETIVQMLIERTRSWYSIEDQDIHYLESLETINQFSGMLT